MLVPERVPISMIDYGRISQKSSLGKDEKNHLNTGRKNMTFAIHHHQNPINHHRQPSTTTINHHHF